MPALSNFDPALGKRIISGVVLAAVSITALLFGGVVLELFITIAIIFMAREWARLARAQTPKERYSVWMATLVPAQIGVLIAFLFGFQVGIAALLVALILTMGVMAATCTSLLNRSAIGALYIGIPCISILAIRDLPNTGVELIIWMFLVIWMTDTAAYLAGRSIGGPKLAPAISPKKTWAGLGGGVLGAMLLGAGLADWIDWGLALAALVAGLLAVSAQFGDLIESYLKRQAGIKDSGRLIPGHGGILDRVDGVMTAAPVMLFVTILVLD